MSRAPSKQTTDRRSVHTRCFKEQYAEIERDGRKSSTVIAEWHECWKLLNPDLAERTDVRAVGRATERVI